MQIKNKKIVSYFFILIMLFSGIFCENIQEIPSFGCTSANHSQTSIDAYNDTFIETAVCTIEMLGVRSFSFVQQLANKSTQRIAVRFILNYMLINCILHVFTKFFLTAHIVQFRELYGQTVLVHYIHDKDGKKQLSSI